MFIHSTLIEKKNFTVGILFVSSEANTLNFSGWYLSIKTHWIWSHVTISYLCACVSQFWSLQSRHLYSYLRKNVFLITKLMGWYLKVLCSPSVAGSWTAKVWQSNRHKDPGIVCIPNIRQLVVITLLQEQHTAWPTYMSHIV